MDLTGNNFIHLEIFYQYFDPLRTISIITLIHLENIQEIGQVWNFRFGSLLRNAPFRVIFVIKLTFIHFQNGH